MARRKKIKKPRKTRNMIALAAILRNGAGAMRDRRKRRHGDRTDNWRKEQDA